MKTKVAWMLTLWMALVLEHSRSDWIPSGSLMLPLSVGCLFWTRNGFGCLLAGLALTALWVLRPSFAPLDVVIVLVMAAMYITRGRMQDRWSPAESRPTQQTWWRHPVSVMLLGIVAHALLQPETNSANAISEIAHRLLIAVPCLIACLLVARTADEFGWRRRTTI